MHKADDRHFGFYLLLAAVVILFDQLSKFWVLKNLELYQSIPLIPSFSIVHARNYGAAFGFLNNAGGWQTMFFAVVALIVSIVLVVWLKRIATTERQLAYALALILGGAIGNLIDRLQFNYVVDFLLFYYQSWQFPAFNLADAAISVGAAILLIDSFGWKLIPNHRDQEETTRPLKGEDE
jgi:signal peptidase II